MTSMEMRTQLLRSVLTPCHSSVTRFVTHRHHTDGAKPQCSPSGEGYLAIARHMSCPQLGLAWDVARALNMQATCVFMCPGTVCGVFLASPGVLNIPWQRSESAMQVASHHVVPATGLLLTHLQHGSSVMTVHTTYNQ